MTDADLTPIPYLGTGLVTAEPVKPARFVSFGDRRDMTSLGSNRRRCGGWQTPSDGFPGCSTTSSPARAADPLLLYSRLIVLSGMRRAVPGHISFGMEPCWSFTVVW